MTLSGVCSRANRLPPLTAALSLHCTSLGQNRNSTRYCAGAAQHWGLVRAWAQATRNFKPRGLKRVVRARVGREGQPLWLSLLRVCRARVARFSRDALERWGAFVDWLVHRSAFHLYLIGIRTDKGFNHMGPGDSVRATRVEEILEADH